MKIILIAKYVTVVTVAFTFSKQNKTNFKTSYPLYGVSQSPTSQLMGKALGLKHTEINKQRNAKEHTKQASPSNQNGS